MNKLDIVSQIADMKDNDYRNTLAIATLIELLIEKNIITRQEFSRKSFYLDNITLEELKESRAKRNSR
ncbi:hypothetical protein [Alkaliphilus serpentinus]|uniref:Uncharacterized protein n=1 Tax=Alkaliphilus serpentinus TaxID=1482731 RepID=A0A833M7N0_9FIRM|nr:hypothetical protein [Alkaliphilus serpentinus]KAB3528948.1 hypothetical protein F8153_10630 [Alkaliphilus serpentinus]